MINEDSAQPVHQISLINYESSKSHQNVRQAVKTMTLARPLKASPCEHHIYHKKWGLQGYRLFTLYTPTPLKHYSWHPRKKSVLAKQPCRINQKCIDYIQNCILINE